MPILYVLSDVLNRTSDTIDSVATLGINLEYDLAVSTTACVDGALSS